LFSFTWQIDALAFDHENTIRLDTSTNQEHAHINISETGKCMIPEKIMTLLGYSIIDKGTKMDVSMRFLNTQIIQETQRQVTC